jgi:peptidoglycan/xylan/chitin deacetylase (PgdA/CDA1 family)
MNTNETNAKDRSGKVTPVVSGKLNESDCIFTYHKIILEDSKYLYHVTAAEFGKHLGFISKTAADSSNVSKPAVSFDDGHRSDYEQAFPILDSANIKATFFILAGCVGREANYISWEQARQMANSGHCVASHGWSHKILTQCTPAELQREIADSKREIEDRLGVEVNSISAPGGRWNSRVSEACENAGYRYFYHSNPWAHPRSLNTLKIRGRHMVTGHMGVEELHKLHTTSGAQRIAKSALYLAKDGLRSALGDKLYHKIWCRLANWNPEEGMEVQIGSSAPGE